MCCCEHHTEVASGVTRTQAELSGPFHTAGIAFPASAAHSPFQSMASKGEALQAQTSPPTGATRLLHPTFSTP